MSKKYEIKQPKKCQSCEKASNCEFLKTLHQKPFDARGILLNSKAFYAVFYELEKCYCTPFDNDERIQQYREKLNAGNHLYLDPALVTNGVLAAELAMKALTFKETGTFDCTHDLDRLFYALPDKYRLELSDIIKEKSHQNDNTIKAQLETTSGFFVNWRYSFEREAIGYTNFLNEFIHIVCEYAFKKIDTYISI